MASISQRKGVTVGKIVPCCTHPRVPSTLNCKVLCACRDCLPLSYGDNIYWLSVCIRQSARCFSDTIHRVTYMKDMCELWNTILKWTTLTLPPNQRNMAAPIALDSLYTPLWSLYFCPIYLPVWMFCWLFPWLKKMRVYYSRGAEGGHETPVDVSVCGYQGSLSGI